jgi:acetate kinase
MFCYSVRKQIAAMIAVLGGVDLIVFTGGIGENDVEVRGAICGGLNWAGVALQDERDDRSMPRCQVRVLASQEDEQIARHTRGLAMTGLWR